MTLQKILRFCGKIYMLHNCILSFNFFTNLCFKITVHSWDEYKCFSSLFFFLIHRLYLVAFYGCYLFIYLYAWIYQYSHLFFLVYNYSILSHFMSQKFLFVLQVHFCLYLNYCLLQNLVLNRVWGINLIFFLND